MNKEEQDCDTCKHCILEMYDEKTGNSVYRYECGDDCNYEPRDEVILEGPRPSEVRPLMSNDFYITRDMFGKSELIGPDEHAIFDAKNGTITIVKNNKGEEDAQKRGKTFNHSK